LLLQHYMATLRDLIQIASCTSEAFIGRVR
jgi:hypothetical protein